MDSGSSRRNNQDNIARVQSTLPKDLPLQFLKDITNDFATGRQIGRGAFGVVYKGMLQNGEMMAVKKLIVLPGGLQDKQFQNEVGSLMALKHQNIVELIGYCYEIQRKVVESNGKYILTDTAEKVLCYQYMSNGSLDNHLFDESPGLDWHMRFNIIKGICNGLLFLHEGLEKPIIHMDLKPANILLDENMVPKIADFGLSRLFGQEQTRTCTQNVVGSIGYMAPEYLYRGEISHQTDIFSLGILIIEIVTGIKNNPTRQDMSSRNLIENVRKSWMNVSHIASKYPSLDANSLEEVKRCIQVALKCVETMPKNRPSTGQVVNMLNGKGA